jgi:hypothetical protein
MNKRKTTGILVIVLCVTPFGIFRLQLCDARRCKRFDPRGYCIIQLTSEGITEGISIKHRGFKQQIP